MCFLLHFLRAFPAQQITMGRFLVEGRLGVKNPEGAQSIRLASDWSIQYRCSHLVPCADPATSRSQQPITLVLDDTRPKQHSCSRSSNTTESRIIQHCIEPISILAACDPSSLRQACTLRFYHVFVTVIVFD
jgi:hypothetical protein